MEDTIVSSSNLSPNVGRCIDLFAENKNARQVESGMICITEQHSSVHHLNYHFLNMTSIDNTGKCDPASKNNHQNFNLNTMLKNNKLNHVLD